MPLIEEGPKEIAASGEMMAVMNSLIPRERSVIEALIKCNGRMIQAQTRYETNPSDPRSP